MGCLKQISDLLDLMVEIEIDSNVYSVVGVLSEHQNTLKNYELSIEIMFKIVDMVMEKIQVVEQKMEQESNTCVRCRQMKLLAAKKAMIEYVER